MTNNHSPTDPDALLSLVERLKENYQQPPHQPPRRGKKRDFSTLSFLLLAAVAVTLRTFRNSELHNLLEKDVALRSALGFSRVPHRTQIGRRLAGLIAEAEQQIALLGKQIVEQDQAHSNKCRVCSSSMVFTSYGICYRTSRLTERVNGAGRSIRNSLRAFRSNTLLGCGISY